MFARLKQYLPSQVKEAAYLAELIERDRTLINTPDVMLLEQQAEQVVFLYCDKQRKHPRACDGMEVLWEGYTSHPFLFWKHDLAKLSHPIATHALPEFKRLPMLPIRGEVVKMSTHRLVQLDREKQNRVHYRRLRVPITVKLHQWVETKNKVGMELLHGIPQRRGDYYPIPVTYTVWAWMYIGIAKYWSPLFDGGYLFKEGRIITPNKSRLKENRYYYFPPTEYSG